ncbi:sigma-E factor negative regulatory protein [Idiomarina sp. UBA3162]|uniref:sigma-E factor negative regulatory protein n=1 Tax=Idiomarina sp. UBA3162 TaxID=1946641 RepID=UPI000C8BD016|nr:sigma-E factor negative regulatory protein [Idiomarina sp. UBA3162]MAD54347.1 negative regulator of sigma E activity [Idiomarinaceae bacterium]|tara:strand:+ start:1053 stop:1727 length:675 start_codon:yes stop_codon:yes gene_type:complete
MSKAHLSNDKSESANDRQESWSALFDSELDAIEQADFDAQLEDAEQSDRWYRYSVIKSAMKGELNHNGPLDISAAVAAEIDAMPATSNEVDSDNVVQAHGSSRSAAARKAAMRWFNPVAKVAVAAGVAAVALITVQTYQTPTDASGVEQPSILTNPLGARQPVSFSPNSTPSASTTQQALEQSMRRQAQSYMIDHQQQLMMLSTEAANSEEQAEAGKQQDPQSP